jgi:hypothetical protein
MRSSSQGRISRPTLDQLAWTSGLTKMGNGCHPAPALPAELRRQAHQPLGQRLGIVAHGVYRSGADRNMAVPDVEAVEAWELADSAVEDRAREDGRLELCGLGPAIEHTEGSKARQLFVNALRIAHGL